MFTIKFPLCKKKQPEPPVKVFATCYPNCVGAACKSGKWITLKEVIKMSDGTSKEQEVSMCAEAWAVKLQIEHNAILTAMRNNAQKRGP